MKKFTKLFLSLALLFVGVGGANAVIKTDWDPSDAFGTTWNSESNTLSWNKNWANVLYTGFAPKANGNTTEVNLSIYSKIHYNITSLSGTASDADGAYIDLKVRSTGKTDLSIKLREGSHDIVFANYAETIDFSKILELTVSATYADGAADNDPGSAVITEMYLYTDRYEYQTQQQTFTTYSLGTALSLSSVVSGNTLVSIAGTDNTILYGKAVDGSEWGSNQIKPLALDDVMALTEGDDNTSYQFRIIDATSEVTTMPNGITKLYRIKAFKKDGTTPFTGPGWNGNNSFYLQEISWTMNVADGTSETDASFFSISPVEGKENTYKISAYKKDGTSGYKEMIYNKPEWIFSVVSATQQQQDVQVLVEVQGEDTEDPGVPVVEDGWVSLITNGDLKGTDVSSFWTKDENGTAEAAIIDANGGRMNGRGIKVVSKDNAGSDWGTQFFVKSSESLKVGQKFHIEFDYRADRPIDAATQAHMAPGSYNCNIGVINFTVNWKHFSETYEVTADMCKNGDMLSFGMNLSHDRKTNNFYFDNIVLWTEDDPLKPQKIALQNAIANANGRTLGKTEESASTLSNAITAGQTALNATDATAESLTNAKTAIDDAINGLKYAAGYAKVTKDMFMTWDKDDADAKATGKSPAGADNIGVENAGVPYGYGNGQVRWNHYTDLTPYEKLYAIGTKGKRARYLFNRVQTSGNPDAEGGTYVEKYVTLGDNGVAELTLSEVGDFAHLNTFKRPDDGTTFTEFFVYAANTTAKVGEAGYATFSSIMNVDLSGVTGYAAQYDGSKVILTQITEYPAGAAIIIEAAEGSYSLTNIESADAIANNDLKVSDGSIAGDGSTIFVLADGGNGVGFYLLKSGDKVPAGKAYLKIENSGSSREFIAIDGNATAIKSVETEKANGAIYNMAGQQVKNAQKGIFIMNGKKVIK